MLKHLTVLACNCYVIAKSHGLTYGSNIRNDTGLWRYIANCIDIPQNKPNIIFSTKR